MFKNVLLATDFSHRAQAIRKLAIRLCSEQEATLTVLHVDRSSGHLWEEGVLVPSDEAERTVVQQRAAELQAALEDYVHLIREAGIEVETVIRDGRASEEILAEAERRECDLIIVGSHSRRPFLDVLMGDTAAKVSRGSPVPVLVVSGGGPGKRP